MLFWLINNHVKNKKINQNTVSKVVYLTNDTAVDIVKDLIESTGDNNTYTYNLSEETDKSLTVEVKQNNKVVKKYMLTYTTDSSGNKVLDCINRLSLESETRQFTFTNGFYAVSRR